MILNQRQRRLRNLRSFTIQLFGRNSQGGIHLWRMKEQIIPLFRRRRKRTRRMAATAIVHGISLLHRWPFPRQSDTMHVIGHKLGTVVGGAFGTDSIQGHLQPFGVLLHGFLLALHQVAVYVVPAIRVGGELVSLPSGHVAFDEFEP